MEPLSFKGRRGSGLPGGRNAYADTSLTPTGGDWEKFTYTFRLFGRLLYYGLPQGIGTAMGILLAMSSTEVKAAGRREP